MPLTGVSIVTTSDRVTRGACTRYRRFGNGPPTRHVELIPERTGRLGADVFEPLAGERGQDVGRPRRVRLARRDTLAARIEHATEAERSEQERQIEGGAEHGGAQIGIRRLDALARTERDVSERALVVTQRDFVLGAAIDVVEDDRRQTRLRHSPQVGDVDGL